MNKQKREESIDDLSENNLISKALRIREKIEENIMKGHYDERKLKKYKSFIKKVDNMISVLEESNRRKKELEIAIKEIIKEKRRNFR